MNLTETDTGYTLDGHAECKACKGTGLYVGMGERDGAAVICHKCKGTGRVAVKLKFTKFHKRKIKKGVTRVFAKGCEYTMHDYDVAINDKGIAMPFTQYGATYQEWLDGKTPRPLEFLEPRSKDHD